MSILDLHADEQVQASLNTAPAPVAPPAKFSAWSAIPRAIGVAAGEVGASVADLAHAAMVARTIPQSQMDQTGLPVSAVTSELGNTVRSYWDQFKPDPNTASTAEQVLFGFSRGLAKVVPATIALGPAGAILAGVEEGMTVSDELRRKGVGVDARTKAGVIQGAGLASAALPLLGTSLAETAALYVAGGPGGFMAQQAMTRKILENAGHDQLAQGYDPFDPVGLAVASLIPAGFTAWGLRGQAKAAKAGAAADAAKAAEDFRTGPVPSQRTAIADAAAQTADTMRMPREVVDAAMVQNVRDFAESQAEALRPPTVALHGSSETFDAFQIMEGRNPAMFFSEDGTGRKTQAEHIAGGPFGGVLYRVEIGPGKKFNPYDDPKAAEIFARLFPDRQTKTVEYPDIYIDSPLIQEMRANGYNRVRVYEPSVQGFSEAVTDPSLIRIVARKDVKGGGDWVSTDPAPRAADTTPKAAEPPKPAAEGATADPVAKLNEPAGAAPKPAADPVMSTVAARVADLEQTAPDLVIRMTDDGKPVTLAQELAEVRRLAAEGSDTELGTLDADLVRVAAECALSTGG